MRRCSAFDFERPSGRLPLVGLAASEQIPRRDLHGVEVPQDVGDARAKDLRAAAPDESRSQQGQQKTSRTRVRGSQLELRSACQNLKCIYYSYVRVKTIPSSLTETCYGVVSCWSCFEGLQIITFENMSFESAGMAARHELA